ncbi:MAG: leucine-rich repeat domain-containing protein [Bacteroidia bacterium]
MKKIVYSEGCKMFFLLQFLVFTLFQASAQQYEDKSYLKKNSTDNHRAKLIPDSKYGAVVSQYNLDEALKNPDKYRSARFYQAGLKEFPEQLFLFKNLEEIDLASNQISTLPNRLTEFKQLKEIHVNNNKLTSLGSEITNCTQLVVLQIQDNPLKSISADIAKLTMLEELTMGEFAPECVLPNELWTLTNLKKIKITNANITQIPAEIKNFKRLDVLCLTHNAIASIPNEVYSLSTITYLNLGHNKIDKLSSDIIKLENLNYLGVFYNPLKSIPSEVMSLKKLSFISCWKTNISQKEIDKIKFRLPNVVVHDTETGLH